jgi:predicted DNA-binding protein (MmcQ/YjbR family)
MNVDAIREFCLAFPHAKENLQWGDDLCFKVSGKIFTIVSLDNSRLCFKCTPETFADLIEREDIRPAPYVGRYKWVMLDRLDALPNDELEELIRQSYAMVAAKAHKHKPAKSKSMKKGGKKRTVQPKSHRKKD